MRCGGDCLENEADVCPPHQAVLTKARADAACGQNQTASAAAVSAPLVPPRKEPQSNLQTRNWICRDTPAGLLCSTNACLLQIRCGASVRQRDVANCLNARTDRKLELVQPALRETRDDPPSGLMAEAPISVEAAHRKQSLPSECGSACDASCVQWNALDPLRPA